MATNDFTDNVIVTNGTSPAIQCKESGGGSTTILQMFDEGAGLGQFRYSNSSGGAEIRMDPLASDGSSAAAFGLFRNTNTSGGRTFNFYKGDGTGTVTATLNAANGNLQHDGDLDTDGNADIAGTLDVHGDVDVIDAHYESSQTTAPTSTLTSTTLNAGGAGASIVLGSNSTDNAGDVTITAGNGAPTAGIAGQIVFDTAYAATPRAVILQPKDADAVDLQWYVSALSTTSFEISLNSAMAASEVAEFYYWVIG